MAAIRFPAADAGACPAKPLAWALVCAAAIAGASARPASAAPPLRDAAVVWYDDDWQDIARPAKRDPNMLWDAPLETVVRPAARATNPTRAVRKVGVLFGGDHVAAAANLNALDEVPNSTWFTNRIGMFPLSPAGVAQGPGPGNGPEPAERWTVVAAKTEGVTLGFNVRDVHGDVYVIKFDPEGFLGMSTAASAISSRLLFAAGYNTSEDGAVVFDRAQLVVGEGVQFTGPDGHPRTMTEADLDGILGGADRLPSGQWLAVYSKYLTGKPVGPFDYVGRRKDDPNDRIDHQDRRELRGLKLFCSWLNHFDTKQHNSLDMYVEEQGRHFLRHHLIDFTATLGAGGRGPTARYGYEFTVDPLPVFGRTLSLGLHESSWRKLRRPEGLPEVGFFESEIYDPLEFKPLQPNGSFANMTDRDGYWAAKIITAFTDQHLEAVCARAGYQDPRAAAYVARILGERRDKIAREFFTRVPPLDFFVCDGDRVTFHDLGTERGIFPPQESRYRARVCAVSAQRDRVATGDWVELDARSRVGTLLVIDLTDAAFAGAKSSPEAAPFLAVECQLSRGEGWSSTTTAYVARASRRVVALER